MHTSQRRSLVFTLKILDQFVLACAFFLTTATISDGVDMIRFYEFLFVRVRVVNFALYSAFAWLWYGIFWSLGLYHSYRFRRWTTILKEVVHATLGGTFLLLGMGLIFSINLITPQFLMVF